MNEERKKERKKQTNKQTRNKQRNKQTINVDFVPNCDVMRGGFRWSTHESKWIEEERFQATKLNRN